MKILVVTMIKASGSLAGLLIAILLLEYLSVEQLGLYYLTISITRLTGLAFTSGLGNAVIPEIQASARGDKVSSTALILALILTATCVAVAFGTTKMLEDRVTLIQAVQGKLLALLAGAATMQVVLTQIQRASGRLIIAGLLQEGQGRNILLLFGVAVVLLNASGSPGDLSLVLWLVLWATAVPILIGLLALGSRSYFSFDAESAKKLLRTGYRFLPAMLITLGLPHLILILTGTLGGAAAAAVFGFAQRIFGAVGIFHQAISLAFLKPTRLLRAERLKAASHSIVRFSCASAVGTLALVVSFLVLGVPILARFTDFTQLPGVIAVIAVLLITMMVKAVFGLSRMFLTNLGAYRVITLLNLVGAGAAFAICVVFIPALGALGAAFAVLANALVLSLGATLVLRRSYGLPRLDRRRIAVDARTLRRGGLIRAARAALAGIKRRSP